MALLDVAQQIADKNKVSAVTQDFDESKGVAGRVNSLISGGGPLMKTAQTKAAQSAASRGLKNSSLGVQAGQQAVIETATPIASADASLYQQQALTNQQAQNSAAAQNSAQGQAAGLTGMQQDEMGRQFDSQIGESRRQFDSSQSLSRDLAATDENFRRAQLGETGRQFDASQSLSRDVAATDENFRRSQLATQQEQFARQQQQEVLLANMDASNREKLLSMEAQFKTDIQSNINISQAWGTAQDAISKIQNNSDLDAATKTTLIQNTLGSFQSFANFWNKSSNIDVSDLLNFGVEGSGNDPISKQETTTPSSPNGTGGIITDGSGQIYDPITGQYRWDQGE